MDKQLAFIFPGQGSQAVAMMADLAQQFTVVKQTWEQASSVLGYDMTQLILEGPEQQLNQTVYAQPALLAAGYAAWRVWQQQSEQRPAVVAGHSLGEFTALVCAEAINFDNALQLVADRGKFMQDAVAEGVGAMAAIIGLDEATVVELCAQVSDKGIASAANFNAIGQTVISGDSAAVTEVISLAKQTGAKLAQVLPVSVPSHCQLMQPAAEQFAKRLADVELHSPKMAVIHNVDVSQHSDPKDIKTALVQQLYSPVRWVETIQAMVQQGVTNMVECGPGKVLTGLNKRIDRNITTTPITAAELLTQEGIEKISSPRHPERTK